MSKNYLFYPTKIMNITQNYNGIFSHKNSSSGKPISYPIDEACGDGNRSYFYCCCNELVVKRIYGVGNKGTNTIWLQSTSKVITPTFTDYVTIMVSHPNDATLKNIKVNQKFKRKERMFVEGNDGYATGNHFHIEISRGKFSNLKNNGWVKNSKKAWVLSGKCYKPEECFYIDPSFTIITNSKGLKFKKIPKRTIKNKYIVGDIVSYNKLYTSSTSLKGLKPLIKKGKITKIYKGRKNPYLINRVIGFVNDECIIKKW